MESRSRSLGFSPPGSVTMDWSLLCVLVFSVTRMVGTPVPMPSWEGYMNQMESYMLNYFFKCKVLHANMMDYFVTVMKIKDQRSFGEGVCPVGLHQQWLLEHYGSHFAVFHLCLILVINLAVPS